MLKFLLYLFLFYTVYRVLFGGFKVKVFHYHEGRQAPENPQYNSSEQGKITIDPRVAQKKKEKTDKLGEYVDFEEVK